MFVCLFVCVFGVEVAHVLQERVAKFGHKNYENATKLKVTLTTSTLHSHTHTNTYTDKVNHMHSCNACAQLKPERSQRPVPNTNVGSNLFQFSVYNFQFSVLDNKSDSTIRDWRLVEAPIRQYGS